MRIKHLRFSTKILMISLFGMISIIGTFIILDTFYAGDIIIKTEHQKVREINRLLGQMVAGSLELELYESAEDTFVETMQQDPNILKIILKHNGKTLIEMGEIQEKESIRVSHPIISPNTNRQLSTLEMCYTTKHLRENLFSHSIINILLGLFGLAAVIVMYIIINYLTQPLNFLAEKVRDFKPDEPKVDIPSTDRKDELGILQNTIHITIKKVVEYHQNIQELNQNLETKVEERTCELRNTEQQLKDKLQELTLAYEELKRTQNQLIESEKMASLGSLVAGVAHEINTPVGVSVTAASMLHNNAEQLMLKYNNEILTAKEFEEYLQTLHEGTDMVLRNLRNASSLIDSFKHVSVDQTIDEKRTIDLCKYIEEVVISLKPRYKNKVDSIEIDCQEPIKILTYPGAIAQIITNLVLNSIIHGFEKMEEGKISIHLHHSDGLISFIYRDNGKGIPEHIRPKIFDPFFTTKKYEGGTGLGLHIVFNLVTHKLAGNIRAESIPGEGTSFTITLRLDSHSHQNL